MGVRGLTTYIANNSKQYLTKHKLHDCLLVIDGNNLASQLYIWVSKSNSAYGGDYDRYYKCVKEFFTRLKQCKITPLVVFDGGYETRKLGTVWQRLRNRLLACHRLTPSNQMRRNVFPLLMKDVFRNVLHELDISFAQCDFEADEHIAALARELKCSVLSYDSDFYVFDVNYIPFNSFELTISNETDKSTGKSFCYIGCEIYNVDRFVSSFGGLQQDMLPLMATLLGNDYIKRSLFDGFFSQIRMPKNKKSWSIQHRRISGLLQWLRRESLESAVPKILGHLKTGDRKFVARQMKRAIAAYAMRSTYIKKYLQIPDHNQSSPEISDVEVPGQSCEEGKAQGLQDGGGEEHTTEADADEAPSEDEQTSDDMEETSDGKENPLTPAGSETVQPCGDDEDDVLPPNLPDQFLQQFRRGLIPACFMDLFTKSHFYIFQPQKEDFSVKESSHVLSLPLVRYLVTLLVGAEDAVKVRVVTRHHANPSRQPLFSEDCVPDKSLPSLAVIPTLSHGERLALLLNPTGLSPTMLEKLPEEWRLYFVGIAFWAAHAKPPVSDKFVHAVILGMVLLAIVRPSKKENQHSFSKLSQACQNSSVKAALDSIKQAECSVLYGSVYVPHSHAEGKNSRAAFESTVVHGFAQLQSVLLSMTQLNQILEMPLKNIPLHRVFSGTLLYNLYRVLQPRPDISAYLNVSLKHAPSLLSLHLALVNMVLERLAPGTPRAVPRRSRSRRKRKREPSENSSDNETHKQVNNDSDSEDEMCDPNNRFALLSTC